MCKKYKKIIAILTLIFVWTSSSNFSVNAMNEKTSVVQRQNNNIVHSINGKTMSEVLRNSFERMDLVIEDNTLIEMVSLGRVNSGSPNALVITNAEGSLVTKDILIGVDEEGNLQPLTMESGNVVSPMAGETIEYPYPDWDDRLVIRATAVYNVLMDGIWSYYQPVGAYFTYVKNQSSCNVSKIEIEYVTVGHEMTADDFEYLYDETRVYTHKIKVSKTNPAQNTIYHNSSNPYNTSRVLDTAGGHPNVGQYIQFSYTIDGETRGYPVDF